MGNKKSRGINILELIENVRTLINDETNISPALKAALELLISVSMLLAEKRLARNSKNSSLPAAMDPTERKHQRQKENGKRVDRKGIWEPP
jgi:hypothetical protein